MSDQLEQNRKAYNEVKAQLENKYLGRVALFHDGELIGAYNDSGDAYNIGCEKFGLGEFYLAHIGESSISLGIHAMGISSN